MLEHEIKYRYKNGAIEKIKVTLYNHGYVQFPEYEFIKVDEDLFDSAAECYRQNLAEKETELETIQREILELKQALIDFKE